MTQQHRLSDSEEESRVLRAALEEQFPLRDITVVIGDRKYRLTTASDIEQLIDRISEEEFRVDERLPYWADLWHSAVALSEFLAEGRVLLDNLRVLEIGCGLALPGIVAAAAGARVTCSDFEEHARMAARLNILQNLPAQDVAVVDMDFRHPTGERWPLILAADVIYEKRFIEPLTDFLERTLSDDGTLLLAEPNRMIAIPFFDALTQRGFHYHRHAHNTLLHEREVEISIYEVTRSASARSALSRR